jgi:Family of unknown function (DUF6492)
MKPFILFCKSYKNDVLRAKRLIESITQFNVDSIPFYLSIPNSDWQLFQETIPFNQLAIDYPNQFMLIKDEDIVSAIPGSSITEYDQTPGHISQQIIKAETWRLLKCENYLCLDSDSFFTRQFHLANFIHPSGVPYSLLHDNHELLELAKNYKQTKVIDNFLKDSSLLKEEFGRTGKDYDFGPTPTIWSAKVWESLSQQHLESKGERLWDAITRIPSEIRWYGEALLKFQAIPIYPIEPLFTCHHYDWQHRHLKNKDMKNLEALGVTLQSNWDNSLQPKFARKNFLSRAWKKIRYFLNG